MNCQLEEFAVKKAAKWWGKMWIISVFCHTICIFLKFTMSVTNHDSLCHSSFVGPVGLEFLWAFINECFD